jgi:hypothetical protein
VTSDTRDERVDELVGEDGDRHRGRKQDTGGEGGAQIGRRDAGQKEGKDAKGDPARPGGDSVRDAAEQGEGAGMGADGRPPAMGGVVVPARAGRR